MYANNLNKVSWEGAERGVRARGTATLGVGALKAVATLRLWLRRSQQRAALRAALPRDAAFFHDIGVSRASVYNEAGKWFWQA